MKKVLILIVLFIVFVSCSTDDSADDCGCTKNYYKVEGNVITFVNSDSVECQDEVEIQYIDSDTYFTIECK